MILIVDYLITLVFFSPLVIVFVLLLQLHRRWTEKRRGVDTKKWDGWEWWEA